MIKFILIYGINNNIRKIKFDINYEQFNFKN